jgi:hypothetical protein
VRFAFGFGGIDGLERVRQEFAHNLGDVCLAIHREALRIKRANDFFKVIHDYFSDTSETKKLWHKNNSAHRAGKGTFAPFNGTFGKMCRRIRETNREHCPKSELPP